MISDADDHGGAILRGIAIPAAVFSFEKSAISKGGLDDGTVAVSIAEIRRSIRSAASSKADRNHPAFICRKFPQLVVEELAQRIVSINQGNILPAIAIVVQEGKAAAVGVTIQSSESGMITEMFPGIFIQEKAISLVPGERVDDQFPVDDFITGLQPGIDSGIAFTTNFVVFPFLGFSYGTVGQITVSAHDRAPEVTSQVDLGG